MAAMINTGNNKSRMVKMFIGPTNYDILYMQTFSEQMPRHSRLNSLIFLLMAAMNYLNGPHQDSFLPGCKAFS